MSSDIDNKLAVEKIMDRFNFRRVQKAMKALNWCYGGEDDTPSVESLRKCARHLLEETAENKEEYDRMEMSSGGFRAINEDNNYLKLEFIVGMEEVFYEDLHGCYEEEE